MEETSKLTVSTTNVSQTLVFGSVTAAQRDSYFVGDNAPQIGMTIFNNDDKVLETWNGTEWKLALGDRVGGGGGSLYEFSNFSYEATNPQTGQSGPNLTQVQNSIQGADSWKSSSEYLSVNNGKWTWTVPATGNYKIECWGAQGGRSNGYGPAGGQGAYASGTVRLRRNDQILIVVGHMGTGNYYDCGGGGGTYVCQSDNSALVVAAGGGGGSASGMYGPGPQYGNGGETAGSTAWFTGGTGGNGGGGGTAGGGGGLTGNGGGSWGGQSFTNGSVGGANAVGGFGGGGGGGGTNGAGGGGGYNGGGGSYWSFYGAGGGSYVISTATAPTTQSNVKTNGGKVSISKV